MYTKSTTRRVRALIAGALIAGAMAVGVAADTTSAAKADSGDEQAVTVELGGDFRSMSMRSGIRW